MSWQEALKQYNASSGNPYVIPKKGTDAYNKVKSIQEKLGGAPIVGKGMNGIEAKLNKSAGKGFVCWISQTCKWSNRQQFGGSSGQCAFSGWRNACEKDYLERWEAEI